jgi:prevent-host-death family protein
MVECCRVEWAGTIMKEVAALEAKTKLSHLLDLVEAGEETAITTRRGKPVARLVSATPAVSEFDREKAPATATARIIERSKGVLGGLKIRDLINEGQP